MSTIRAHGYIGLTAPDVGAWREYAATVLGMSVRDGADPGQILLRMDERAWRISVEPGDGALAYCGWEVADEQALDRLVAHLEEHGFGVKDEPGLAERRQVRAVVTSEDPGGNRLEFFYGAFVPATPFVSPTGATFVTSDSEHGELGFGHAVLTYPDEAQARHFYLDVLGFKVSDVLASDVATATFTHVNARHHSLAFAEIPGQPSSLNHLMVEVSDLDMVGRALDVVHDRGDRVVLTLGKHTNDHMTSFYAITPSGVALEYGHAGRYVDDATWTVATYDRPSFWGHRGAFADDTSTDSKEA